MAYATTDQMITRFGETSVITSCDRDLDGSVDTSSLERALDDASSRMDAYLGARYTVPVASPPDLLVDLCCDIALYIAASDAGTITDDKRLRFEDAIKMLKDIAAGKATIGDETIEAPDPAQIVVSTNERLFTRDEMDW